MIELIFKFTLTEVKKLMADENLPEYAGKKAVDFGAYLGYALVTVAAVLAVAGGTVLTLVGAI